MADPFIGQIVMFGGNFAPRGWAQCDGQLLSIASNTALFSILGTTFTGEAVATTQFGPYDAVIPQVTGAAYITGCNELLIDLDDPLRNGFLLR